jgi:hypothetical protein
LNIFRGYVISDELRVDAVDTIGLSLVATEKRLHRNSVQASGNVGL